VSDRLFRRIGSWCAFAIAVLSILYAIVYLGFVRPNPANLTFKKDGPRLAIGALSPSA
jgi:hypothetical protein